MIAHERPYDPDARRDTPLALKLKDRIRREGPIAVDEYMKACLQDPEHGYYRTKAAIGRGGDFITAPEISQVFGELIGLWCAVVWQQMGAPPQVNLVELGPGRGTLMRDALRAARVVPGFAGAASLVFVDIRPGFADASPPMPLIPPEQITWITDVRDIPADVPAIVIANEFLDTFPVQQFEARGGVLLIRGVGLDPRGALAFVSTKGGDARRIEHNPAPAEGTIVEAADLSGLWGLRNQRTAPWAALFIDYGHYDPGRDMNRVLPAETLQAVRAHRPEHPLCSPGEADLTCQVDFNEVKRQFELTPAGVPSLAVDGPVTQAEFLGSLGIVERASRLMAANPQRAAEIEMGVARLMAVPGMGSRFKAMGIRSTGLPPLPGFPVLRTASS